MGIKRAVQDKIALEKLKKKYRQCIRNADIKLEMLNYRIRMNKEQNRIELLRVRGQGKIDNKWNM